MQLVEMIDYANAPEISVDGVGRIERISHNLIRVSYYTAHYSGSAGYENRLCLAVRWDRASYFATGRIFHNARPMLEADDTELAAVTGRFNPRH